MAIAELITRLWNGREQRRHPRLREPAITLRIGRRRVRTIDWSLGGCLVVGAALGDGPFRIGAQVAGTFRLAGVPEGEFLAEVARLAPAGEVGLRWLEIRAASFIAMSAEYDSSRALG